MTTLSQVYKAPKIQPGKETKPKPANSLEPIPQAVQPKQINMTSKPMTDNNDIYKLGSYQAIRDLGLEKHAMILPAVRAIGMAARGVAGRVPGPVRKAFSAATGTPGQVASGVVDTSGRAGDIGRGIPLPR